MIGQTLSHFKITAKLGEGGMGEVYRADDTNLKREVAIKVLPEAFVQDPERFARFEREAYVLASLNHPHIASIYDLTEDQGTHFLVLELVEGEDLAAQLSRGALPMSDALSLALQIAEAIEAAHRKGIVHRDLKPGNIMIGAERQVKVLDFGLAKNWAPASDEANLTHSPTLTTPMTETGVIMGTAAYMSPEQARGQVVDKQADIWAFGCVLYEMIAGMRAFGCPTVTETLAAVLEREPDWEAISEGAPGLVSRLIRRCLEKDPKRRLHDIADVRIEIEEALQGSDSARATELPAKTPSAALRAVLWGLAGLAVVLGLGWLANRPRPPVAQPVLRLDLQPPLGVALTGRGQATPRLAISPDGRLVAFTGAPEGSTLIEDLRIYLRSVGELDAQPVQGTKAGASPFFSPDGSWLAFLDVAEGWVKKVPVPGGGEPIPIFQAGRLRGASWGEDGNIVYAAGGGLRQVSADGGEPKILTVPDADRGEATHYWPQILPGGRSVVFVARGLLARESRRRIVSLSLETGEVRGLLTGGTSPRYLDSGHLVYSRLGTLYAAPFDPDRLTVIGSPQPVLGNVDYYWGSGRVAYAIAKSGALIFMPGVPTVSDRDLVWLDRDGRRERLATSPRPFYKRPALSPDGSRLIVAIESSAETVDLWTYDFARDDWERLTRDGGEAPVWSPDGKWIAFSSDRTGAWKLYRIPVDGGGEAEQLTMGEWADYPASYSPDGQFLAFERQVGLTEIDVLILPLREEGEPSPFLSATGQKAFAATFSPHGDWVAYAAVEGAQRDVYVTPFPGPGPRIKVSSGGGRMPIWSRSGNEIFYRVGRRVYAVDWLAEPEPVVGKPDLLFESGVLADDVAANPLALSPDGDRFLVVEHPKETHAPLRLVYVPNWVDEIEQLLANPGEQ